MEEFFTLLLNADETVSQLVQQYGTLTYLIIFSIIFIETGLVVVNFFPGDGLLFAAGVLASGGELNLSVLILLLSLATFLGNTSNYFIGKFLGRKFFKKENPKRNEHISNALFYFDKYGSRAVLASRFFPFMRSFIPFVAGLTSMSFRVFTFANLVGGVLWICSYVLLGYFTGDIPIVQQYFGLVISILFILIIVSGLASLIRYLFSKPS